MTIIAEALQIHQWRVIYYDFMERNHSGHF